jgi:hypothetical protein
MGEQLTKLREQQLAASYRDGVRQGACWSLREVARPLDLAAVAYDDHHARLLAGLPSAYEFIEPSHRQGLANLGYLITDRALTRAGISDTHITREMLPYPGDPYVRSSAVA